MLGKRRGAPSPRRGRPVDVPVVGSHVTPSPSPRARHARSRGGDPGPGASRVDFSNARRAHAAQRGYVSHVGVSAQSGESASAYARRTSRLGYAQEIQRKSKRKRLVFVVLVAILALSVAVAVGMMTYHASTDSTLSAGVGNAPEALVPAEEGAPYYVLCAARLGAAAGPAQGAETDVYLLVRVDAAANALSFAFVPANTSVTLSDGEQHPLYDAAVDGDFAELIGCVSALADVGITHFVTTDAEGLASMVNVLGGLPMTLSEEIDDPRAGHVVLPAGEQTLDGASSVVFLRASNLLGGADARAANRVAFTTALVGRALTAEGLSLAALVGDAGKYLSTDWAASELIAEGEAWGGALAEANVRFCTVPGYETGGEVPLFVPDAQAWSALRERFKAGDDPVVVEPDDTNVNSSDVTVEVRNGASTEGAAARLGEMLGAAGFVVEKVGNVEDGTIYPETLIIYRTFRVVENSEGEPDSEDMSAEEVSQIKAAAGAVMEAAQGGRLVDGGDFYHFDTDVLVIIGKDWMPVL